MPRSRRRRPDYDLLHQITAELKAGCIGSEHSPDPDSILEGPKRPLDFDTVQRRVRREAGYNKQRKCPLGLALRYRFMTQDRDDSALAYLPLQCGRRWAVLDGADALSCGLSLGPYWTLEATRGGPLVYASRRCHDRAGRVSVMRAVMRAEYGERIELRDGDPLNLRRSNLYFSRETEPGWERRRQSRASARRGDVFGRGGAPD